MNVNGNGTGQLSKVFIICSVFVQVNDYEIDANSFHISHNLTWYCSAIVHKFTGINQVFSTYELTKLTKL